MGENISKKALIDAFNKIKSHFLEIESRISQNTAKLAEIEQKLINIENTLYKSQLSPKDISSIGNQGVQTSTQSTNKQTNKQQTSTSNSHFSSKIAIEDLFNTLTNKEFLIFLIIFQSDKLTYNQIAEKLSISPSCIRGFICSMMHKKIPLVKHKLKSGKVLLSVEKEFKTLTSEQKLINLYYENIDPDQTTLI